MHVVTKTRFQGLSCSCSREEEKLIKGLSQTCNIVEYCTTLKDFAKQIKLLDLTLFNTVELILLNAFYHPRKLNFVDYFLNEQVFSVIAHSGQTNSTLFFTPGNKRKAGWF